MQFNLYYNIKSTLRNKLQRQSCIQYQPCRIINTLLKLFADGLFDDSFWLNYYFLEQQNFINNSVFEQDDQIPARQQQHRKGRRI